MTLVLAFASASGVPAAGADDDHEVPPPVAAVDPPAIAFDGEGGGMAGTSSGSGASVTAGAAHRGTAGLAVASTAAPGFARWNADVLPSGHTHATARLWFRVLDRAPGESVDLFTIQNARRTENFDFFVNGLTGRLQWDLYRGDTDGVDAPVEIGRWYLFEAQVEFAGSQYSATVRLDGVAQGTITSSYPATTVRSVWVGAETAKTHVQHYDDLAVWVGDAALGWPATRPPTVALTVPAENAVYGRGETVMADVDCLAGDLTVTSCAAPVPDGSPLDTATLGDHEFTVTATDLLGGTTSVTHHYTVVDVTPPDGTPPLIDLRSPPEGATYGRGDSAVADYDCADDVGGSGLAVEGCVGPVADGAAIDTAALGPHEFTVTATDAVGNETSVTHHYTVVDRSAPVLELRRPVDGAVLGRGEVVAADFACADEVGGSGLAPVQGCVGPAPSGSAIDTAVLGAHEFTVTATDAAGNETSVSHGYTVVDRTSPVVELRAPAAEAVYARGALVPADYECFDEIGGGGLRDHGSCVGPVAVGAPIDTWTLGDHPFTVTANDATGNIGWTTHTYTVLDNQPDVMIGEGAVGRFAGADVYNGTAVGQTRAGRVPLGGAAVFVIRVQNDTGARDRFGLRGDGADQGWRVRYLDGRRDVTGAVVRGTYRVGPLAPGAVDELRVVVRSTDRVTRGARHTVRITSSARGRGRAQDTVAARLLRV